MPPSPRGVDGTIGPPTSTAFSATGTQLSFTRPATAVRPSVGRAAAAAQGCCNGSDAVNRGDDPPEGGPSVVHVAPCRPDAKWPPHAACPPPAGQWRNRQQISQAFSTS
ncbi:hypothetical protein Q1695_003184 [Nippostrongylus brasiliensis]|nr:hypothetical protein Q1695_003184 [Nippostrongylus brasiliensis]